MKHVNKKTKILFSVLFPILLVAWNFGFDLGAFGTIFYRNMMTAWLFAVVVFLGLVYLKWIEQADIKYRLLLILLIPILWPFVDYFDQHIPNRYIHYFIIIDYLLIILSLGYSLYIFIKLVKYDIFDPLTFRHKAFTLAATLFISMLGFWVGKHNYLFFECGHFTVSGEYTPENCYRPSQQDFRTLYRRTW